MEEPDKGNMEELYQLLNKLHKEAEQLHKHVNEIEKKGELLKNQAESVISESMKQKTKEQTKNALLLLIERLVEMNCHMELADDDAPNLKIPYLTASNNSVKLKFLAGDSPWNFWLTDEAVDTKTIHKNLLKKYQNGLLEQYPNPKSSESVCFLDRNKVFRGVVLQATGEHRVKVLDCDSNIGKVIPIDNVFKADPDACCIHASALKCTISKASVDTDLWKSDLRDIFCDVLKGAALSVKILERLSGSIPCFFVNVNMTNEDENCDGSLEEWILERLLPELKKVSIENEFVSDFLSSEALNPFYKDSLPLEQISGGNLLKSLSESNSCSSEDDNNLNTGTKEINTKVVPNINHTKEEKAVSSESEEQLVSSSNQGQECPSKLNNNEQIPNKTPNHSREFTPPRSVAARLSQMTPHGVAFVQPPHRGYLGYPVQFAVPPPPPPMPFPIPFGQPLLPPHHFPQWHQTNMFPPGNRHPQRASDSSHMTMNGTSSVTNVNVMAPEFVPKVNSDMSQNHVGPQATFTRQSTTPELPVNREIVHFVLRKPSSLLKPGENLLVMISHVLSPAEFYVHFITKNNQYLDKLKEDMFAYYNNIEKATYESHQEARRVLGDFCACKWVEDNHWYRVQVVNWCPIGNNVTVNFVDYGNVSVVPLDSIQPLVQQFTKLSMCAQLCHLAKVLPIVKHHPWSEEAIQFFKSKAVVVNSRIYSVTVVPDSRENVAKINSLSVLLYEGKASDGCQSINEQMVESGLAWSKYFSKSIPSSDSDIYLSLDDEQSSPSISDNKATTPNDLFQESDQLSPELEKGWKDWDPLTEDYKSVRNNPARDTDDPGVALIGYSAKDEERICPFYARDGFCRKTLCSKEHTRPNRDGVTTDKEEVYCRAFSEMELPSAGHRIGVLVTCVASISLFYVQLPLHKGCDKDDEEEETLSKLSDFMNRPENVQQMKYLRVPPAVGQLVLANWDDRWYRARVISSDEENLEVMFVDYGSLSTVSELSLREIEPRYLHLPFQAVECSLANIKPPERSCDYNKATEVLKNLIEGNEFEAEIYNSCAGEDFYEMNITLSDQEGDVSERLIETGLVTKRDLNWNFNLNQTSIRCIPG